MQSSIVGIVSMFIGLFLLYTNLPVVAAQSGALPSAAAAIVPALLLVATVHQVVVRRSTLVIDRTLLLIMALLCVFVVSAVNAVGYDVAIGRIIVFVTEGIAVYFLVRNSVRTSSELHAALVAILLAATVLAFLSTVQTVTNNFDQNFLGLAQRDFGDPNARSGAVTLEERAQGPVGEANRFAQILLMTAPIGFVLARNALRLRGTVMAAVCMAIVLGGVLLTYSRGAFVTLVTLMLLAVPLGLLTFRGLVKAGICAMLTMVLVVPGYVGRIVSIAGVADLLGSGPATVEADGATRGRTTEMLAGLAAYVDHPVIGVGPGQYVTYYSPYYQSLPEISIRDITANRRAHSLYIELAAETGTIGLVVFMVIPLLLLRDLELLRRAATPRHPRQARLAGGLSLVVLSYLGTGVFLHLAFERYYWLMIGITAAAIAILREEITAQSATEPEATFGDRRGLYRAPTGGSYAC